MYEADLLSIWYFHYSERSYENLIKFRTTSLQTPLSWVFDKSIHILKLDEACSNETRLNSANWQVGAHGGKFAWASNFICMKHVLCWEMDVLLSLFEGGSRSRWLLVITQPSKQDQRAVIQFYRQRVPTTYKVDIDNLIQMNYRQKVFDLASELNFPVGSCHNLNVVNWVQLDCRINCRLQPRHLTPSETKRCVSQPHGRFFSKEMCML